MKQIAGISRRAYARHRQVDEKQIRKKIADGTLKPALLPNGMLDADKADDLLASATVRGGGTSATLVESKRRKTAASCALLADEIESLEGAVIYADLAAEMVRTEGTAIARRIFSIAAVAAPMIVGNNLAVIAEVLRAQVELAMTELTSIEVAEPAKEAVYAGRRFGDMDLAALETVKNDLLAERLEIRRKLNRKELLLISTVSDTWARRLSMLRPNLLGLPNALAAQSEHADFAAVTKMLEVGIASELKSLVCPYFSQADLEAAIARPA